MSDLGLPDKTNYLTVYGTDNTRVARNTINEISGHNISTSWVRNTSSIRDPNARRKVLINLKYFTDKETILMNRHRLENNITIKDVDLESDDLLYEKFHTQFCKFVLNLPKQTGNNACRGELGRFPICNKIWSLAIKYWLRLEHGTDNVFLNNAYNCAKTENHKWVQQVYGILKTYGMGHVWNNPLAFSTQTIGKSFEQRLNDNYIQTWRQTQSNSNRFKLQSELIDTYKVSPYLNNINDIGTRNIISRLRVDMNPLNECMGRQHRVPNRYCPICPSLVESVPHFLFHCPLYDNERSDFFHRVNQSYNSYNEKHKLLYLLNVSDKKDADHIGRFIADIYKKRRHLLP